MEKSMDNRQHKLKMKEMGHKVKSYKKVEMEEIGNIIQKFQLACVNCGDVINYCFEETLEEFLKYSENYRKDNPKCCVCGHRFGTKKRELHEITTKKINIK